MGTLCFLLILYVNLKPLKKQESIIFKNSILFAINYNSSIILRIFVLYPYHMNFFILFISTERAILTLKFPPKLFNKIDDS